MSLQSFALIPTTLPENNDSSSSSHTRTVGIAAGTAIGVVLFVTILLAFLFKHRGGKLKRLWFLDRIRRNRQRRELLAGEDFDDDEFDPGMRYHDYPPARASGTPSHMHSASTASFQGPAMGTPASPPYASYPDPFRSSVPRPSGLGHNPSYEPRLFRARASESGSIFQEAVWPPPAESSRLVDPLLANSSQVRLSGIIDGVMGPFGPESSRPPPSAYPASFAEQTRSNLSLTSSEAHPAPTQQGQERNDVAPALNSTAGPGRETLPASTSGVAAADRAHSRTPSNEARQKWLDRSPRN
jgi:hypothetical protein